MFRRIFDYSSRSAFLRIHTNVWMRRPGSQCMLYFTPKVFCSVEVRSLCWPVKFIHTKLSSSVSLSTWLCAQSCWNRKGKSLNYSDKVGTIKLYKISLYGEVFRISFNGIKLPCSSPENEPATLSVLTFTLGRIVKQMSFSWQPSNSY